MEEIGLFQLENLIISRSPFLFLDVRESDDQEIPAQIAQHLKFATKVAPQQVLAHVNKINLEKIRPVLLISEDEKGARKAGSQLEAAGYTNVYIVAGGLLGLVAEL